MDEIIKPYPSKITLDKDKPVILIATKHDMDAFVKEAGFQKNDFTNLFMSRVYTNEKLTVAGPFMGAPYAVMILENLIFWGGVKFIFLGWAGSIEKGTRIGDVLIPDGAFVNEGTSQNYLNEEYVTADTDLTLVIEKKLNDALIETKRGKIWTTDGVFRETMEKVQKYSKLSANAVEMELSALLSVSKFRNVKCASVQFISDEIYTGKYITGHKSPAFRNNRKSVFEVLTL